MASIGVGGQHSCALTTAGGVKCWGDNVNGYLGNSSTTASFSPVDVTGLTSGVTALSVGYGHTCVVTTTGGAKCWGYGNGDGRLGGGTMTNSSSPVNVSGLTSGVASISAGYYSTCAVTTAGAAKCWGHNGNSQLGNNSTSNSATPVDVSGLASGVKNVSVGGVNACALTTTDAVKCWGNNTFGQLGNNTKVSSGVPVNVSSLSAGVASINTGNNAACAVLTTGGLQCWGANASGQLGINSTTDSLVPVTVSGLTSGVASVVTGTSRACALLTTGTLKCWGENGYGSLGDGTSTRRLVPVDVLQ